MERGWLSRQLFDPAVTSHADADRLLRTEPQVQFTPFVLNNHSNDFKSHCTFPFIGVSVLSSATSIDLSLQNPVSLGSCFPKINQFLTTYFAHPQLLTVHEHNGAVRVAFAVDFTDVVEVDNRRPMNADELPGVQLVT